MTRRARARTRPAGRASSLDAALDAVADRLKRGGRGLRVRGHARRPPTRTCSPSARWPTRWAGMLDFRVGDPQDKVQRARGQRAAARRPQPEHAGLPRPGPGPRRASTRSWPPARAGKVKALVLQGPELLRLRRGARRRWPRVPFIAVMATHERPGARRARTSCCRPRSGPRSDGTFTNYQRRVQRIRRAVPAARRRAAALGAGGGRCCGGWARRSPATLGARGVRRCSPRPCPATPASTYRAVGADRPRAAPPPTAPRAARRRGPDGATRVVTVNRNTQAGRRARSCSGCAITFKNMVEHAVRAPGLDHPVPGAEAQHLRPLPRHPRPHPAHGRHAQVRGLLHVRDGLPGGVHLHRGRRAAGEATSRSTPRASRSTCCAASTAASAWTPARRRRSS